MANHDRPVLLHLVSRVSLFLTLGLAASSVALSSGIPAVPAIPGVPDLGLPQAIAPRPDSAPVRFNERTLFRVVGPTEEEARDRADLIAFRLNTTLRQMSQEAPLPNAHVEEIEGAQVIFLDEQTLLTVTEADASASGRERRELATEWMVRIENAFDEALRERRPAYLGHAIERALAFFAVAFFAGILVWMLTRRWFKQPTWALIILIWLLATHQVLALFPQTRPLHNVLGEGVLRPFSVVVVAAMAAWATAKIWQALIKIAFPPLPDTLSPEERTERTYRRRDTLGTVIRFTGVTVIWFMAVIVALSLSGVNLPALLASAGLIGVAIGLAFQDTMKDMVAGINILLDDRFGVGDTIRVADNQGRVERLNLRITQMRDLSGRLITIPNRDIATVANLTSRWAQVDLTVGVDYDTDLRSAMKLIVKTAEGVARDFESKVLASPEMLGVEAFGESQIDLRLTLRTAPGDQWLIARELRLRVKDAFDDAGIVIPFPQRVISNRAE